MTVLKRQPKDSISDFCQALDNFATLLASQKEDEAIEFLKKNSASFQKLNADSAQLENDMTAFMQEFDDEHELSAYILINQTEEWSESSQLSLAASRVVNLARRFQKK